MFKRLLLLSCIAVMGLQARAAYVPVPVTGYTADVVANGVGPASGSITADVDGAGYAFMAADFNPGVLPTRYMPTGGLINSSSTPTLTFQLASYSTNNSLRMAVSGNDSLVFVTPQSASEVDFLATSGSGISTLNATVNFTDGSSQAFTGMSVNDWYGGPNYAILGLGRVNVTTAGSGGIDNNTLDPRIYEYKLLLLATNYSKVVRSIQFNKTNAVGVLNVMAVSISTVTVVVAPSCVSAPTAPANAGTICAGTGTTTLSWPAVTGATGYDVYLNTGAAATTIVSTNQAGTTYSAAIAAGPYAWKVVPKNATGSATGCATFTFTVNAAVTPSVTITQSPAGSFCAGMPVTFTAVPTNGGTTPSYQWKKNTTNVGTNSAAYTDNALANSDAISVVMTSAAACPSPATATSNVVTVTVLPRPPATITYVGATTFCQGGSLALNANTGTGLTYQWQSGSTDITGATTAAYTAAATGNYRVVVSNGTCSDTSLPVAITVNPLPTAAITPAGPLAFCQGGSVVLDANTGTGLSYQWQLNGVDITGATAASFTANASGVYTVVTTSNGCPATATAVTVTVNALPIATTTAAGPLNFCLPGSVVLGANTGTGLTYQWQRNTINITGATTAAYTATTSGSYQVVVSNANCSVTATALAVTASTLPSATLTPVGSTTFCQGSNLRINAATGTGYTYQWKRNGVDITGSTQSFYFATTAGTYTVVIVNGACTTTSSAITVTVNPLPTATSVAAGPTTFCNGGSVIINANTGTGLTYQWRRNGVNIVGATGAAYTAATAGLYQVIVSNGTCSATSIGVNVVVSTPAAPVIVAGGPVTFCQGNNVNLSVTPGAGYTYQWQLNGVNVPGATASVFSAIAGGVYTVTVTSGACVSTSAPMTVSIIPAPPAVITAAGPVTFCQGDEVILNANRGNNLSYQWSYNGLAVTGATSFNLTAALSGVYTVTIFDGACPATSTAVTVTVNPFPAAVITVTSGVDMSTGVFTSYQWYRNGVLIPGATAQNYSATQDGYYGVVVTDAAGCSATSSIQRITALDISNVGGAILPVMIWPNPTEGMLHIEAARPVNIAITSMDGKLLVGADKATTVDISQLPQGLYLIRIADAATGALIKVDKINKK